jgi:hypothetical protein
VKPNDASRPAPYLPEPEPVETPKAKPQGAKNTLVLWFVLIALFAAVYTFLSPSGSGAAREALPTCEQASVSWGGVALGWIPALLFSGLLIFLWRAFVVGNEFHRTLETSHVALAEHRYADALAALDGMLAKYRTKLSYGANVHLQRATAFELAGRLDEAVDACIQIERMPSLAFTSGARAFAGARLAELYAMKGDLDASERWAREVRARLAKNHDDRMAYAARLCVAEAIALVRRGSSREAVALLEASWDKLRFTLSGRDMLVPEAVRGLAEAQASLREQNVATVRVLRLGEASRGELAFLGASWPEMRAFLAAHEPELNGSLGTGPAVV